MMVFLAANISVSSGELYYYETEYSGESSYKLFFVVYKNKIILDSFHISESWDHKALDLLKYSRSKSTYEQARVYWLYNNFYEKTEQGQIRKIQIKIDEGKFNLDEYNQPNVQLLFSKLMKKHDLIILLLVFVSIFLLLR